MAWRWRIRHKLIFGLGLVIALIVALLAGTSWGLSSYRSTIYAIDSKLEELEKANNLRARINALAAPAAETRNELLELQSRIKAAEKDLADYERTLHATIRLGHAVDDGFDEKQQAESLKEQLAKLKVLLAEYEPQVRPIRGDEGSLTKTPAIKDALSKLIDTANDLTDVIYKGLDRRMRASKNDYRASFYSVLGVGLGGVLLMIGVVWRFYAWVFGPIRDVKQGVERIAKGDFKYRLQVNSGDEMEELAGRFNHMTDQLDQLYSDLSRQVNERSRQLVRSERLASVGFLAAGVAHEINNPLASIAFCSEALEQRLEGLLNPGDRATIPFHRAAIADEDRETIAKYLKMIQNEAFRCKEITQKLLEFSRGGERKREPTDLNEIIQSVLDVVQHLQNCRGKNLIFQPAAPLVAWVNAQEIKSVVLNLVVNALESMDEGGTLTITHRSIAGMAEIRFTDTGCGMTAEVLENIFEPFFTRSRTGKGTGLGLSISYRIVHQHGGEIEGFSAGPNQGSTFVVRLPLRPAETEQPGEWTTTDRRERRAA